MARLAFGAKCGRPGRPPVGDVAGAAAERSGSSDASAAAPSPRALRPKKWRRVIVWMCSWIGFIVWPPRQLLIRFHFPHVRPQPLNELRAFERPGRDLKDGRLLLTVRGVDLMPVEYQE